MYQRVFSSPVTDVESNIIAYQTLNTRIQNIRASIAAYGDRVALWNNTAMDALASLQNTASELDGMEGIADDQEARVAALKRIIGNS